MVITETGAPNLICMKILCYLWEKTSKWEWNNQRSTQPSEERSDDDHPTYFSLSAAAREAITPIWANAWVTKYWQEGPITITSTKGRRPSQAIVKSTNMHQGWPENKNWPCIKLGLNTLRTWEDKKFVSLTVLQNAIQGVTKTYKKHWGIIS